MPYYFLKVYIHLLCKTHIIKSIHDIILNVQYHVLRHSLPISRISIMQKTMITIESARGDFLYYELHALKKYTPQFFFYTSISGYTGTIL